MCGKGNAQLSREITPFSAIKKSTHLGIGLIESYKSLK